LQLGAFVVIDVARFTGLDEAPALASVLNDRRQPTGMRV
jgi:hypothetical protein